MSFVYVVVERSDDPALVGGGVYSTAYKTFEEAKAAVIAKYKGVLDEQTKVAMEQDLSPPMENINVPESETGFTLLYVEKGINIYIHKLSIHMSGGKRSFSKKSKTRRSKMKTH